MNFNRERIFAEHETLLHREYHLQSLHNSPDTITGLILGAFISTPLILGGIICYESMRHQPTTNARIEQPLKAQNSTGMPYYRGFP